MDIIASYTQSVNNIEKTTSTNVQKPFVRECGLPPWSQIAGRKLEDKDGVTYGTRPFEERMPVQVLGLLKPISMNPMSEDEPACDAPLISTFDKEACSGFRSFYINGAAIDMVVLRVYGRGYKDIDSVGHLGYVKELGIPMPNYVSVCKYDYRFNEYNPDTFSEMVWVFDQPLLFDDPEIKTFRRRMDELIKLLRYYGLSTVELFNEALNWTLSPEEGVWQYRTRDYAYSFKHFMSLLKEMKYQATWGLFRRVLQDRLMKEIAERPKLSERKLERFAAKVAKEMVRRNRIPLPGLEKAKFAKKLSVVSEAKITKSKTHPSVRFPKGFDEKYDIYEGIEVIVEGPLFQKVLRTASAVSNYVWHNRVAPPLPVPRKGRAEKIDGVGQKDYVLNGCRITPEMREKAGNNRASRMALELGRKHIAKKRNNNKRLAIILRECYFTAKEIAEFLNVSERTVRRYFAEDKKAREQGYDFDEFLADNDIDELINNALINQDVDIVPYRNSPSSNQWYPPDAPEYVKAHWRRLERYERRNLSYEVVVNLQLFHCSYYEWLQNFDRTSTNPPYGIILYTLLQYRMEKFGDAIPEIYHNPQYTLAYTADINWPPRRLDQDEKRRSPEETRLFTTLCPPTPPVYLDYDIFVDPPFGEGLRVFQRSGLEMKFTPEYLTARREYMASLMDAEAGGFKTREEEDEFKEQLHKRYEMRLQELIDNRAKYEKTAWREMRGTVKKFKGTHIKKIPGKAANIEFNEMDYGEYLNPHSRKKKKKKRSWYKKKG